MVDPPRVQRQDRPLQRPGDEPARSRPSNKQQPSPFDQVLQQRVVQQTPTFHQQMGKESANQQTRQEERERRHDRKEKPRAREADRTTHKSKEQTHTDAQESGPKHRIVVKTTRDGEGGRQGRGGEGGGQGFSGGRGGGPGTRAKTETEAGKQLADLKAAVGRAGVSKFQQELATQKQPTTVLDRKQMQQLVNLLVQSIRVGKNVVGADELTVVFHAAIFRGLRLRLQAKNGKVSVHFESSSGDVRALFTNERQRIRDALERKGIRVETIEIS